MRDERRARRRARCQAGFTLVEVLVALVLMAILAGFAWQGLDSVMSARDASRVVIDRSTRLATVLTQWEQDLQAVQESGVVPPLSFDGQTLRLTRRVEGGLALVAWSVRGGQWQRWASAAMQRSTALQQTWMASQQLQGHEPGHLQLADEASEWQLHFYRGNGWSNAQSSGDLTAVPTSAGPVAGREELPQAVRLMITLHGQRLRRDIALGPTGT